MRKIINILSLCLVLVLLSSSKKQAPRRIVRRHPTRHGRAITRKTSIQLGLNSLFHGALLVKVERDSTPSLSFNLGVSYSSSLFNIFKKQDLLYQHLISTQVGMQFQVLPDLLQEKRLLRPYLGLSFMFTYHLDYFNKLALGADSPIYSSFSLSLLAEFGAMISIHNKIGLEFYNIIGFADAFDGKFLVNPPLFVWGLGLNLIFFIY